MNYLLLSEIPAAQTSAARTASLEFLQRISAMPVGSFDIHVHLADMFVGKSDKFIADVYSRLAWYLDESVVKGELKSLSTKLPIPEGNITLDSNSELFNALAEIYESENSGFENGFEGMGSLHKICHAIALHDIWHNHAKQATNALGRDYTVLSVEARIGTPTKQAVGSNHRANAKFAAMEDAGILTEATMHTQFDAGILVLDNIQRAEQRVSNTNAKLPADQIAIAIAQDDERNTLIATLSSYPEPVKAALTMYATQMNETEEKFGRYYEAELKRIPVMLAAYQFCQRKLHNEDFSTEFKSLPTSIVIGACNNATAALDKTLAQFTGKASYVYSELKLCVNEAKRLLDRVLVAKMEG